MTRIEMMVANTVIRILPEFGPYINVHQCNELNGWIRDEYVINIKSDIVSDSINIVDNIDKPYLSPVNFFLFSLLLFFCIMCFHLFCHIISRADNIVANKRSKDFKYSFFISTDSK